MSPLPCTGHLPAAFALCGVLLALACPARSARAADGLLVVRAVVQPRTSVRVDQPGSFTVTAADVERGWLEVATPVQVRVRSNVPQGYTLLLEHQLEDVREVQVTGLGPGIVLAGGAAMGPRPATGGGMWTDQVTLRFRFALAPQAHAGQLAWPVRISLLPP